MATVSFVRIVQPFFKNIIYRRSFYPCLQCSGKSSHFYSVLHEYSTSCIRYKSMEEPLKYIDSKTSKMNIKTNIGLEVKPMQPAKRYVYVLSLVAFLVYFCILREENDIDEKLKGNREQEAEYLQLNDLKLKLLYCKKHNLPTAKIEEKMIELQDKLGIPHD